MYNYYCDKLYSSVACSVKRTTFNTLLRTYFSNSSSKIVISYIFIHCISFMFCRSDVLPCGRTVSCVQLHVGIPTTRLQNCRVDLTGTYSPHSRDISFSFPIGEWVKWRQHFSRSHPYSKLHVLPAIHFPSLRFAQFFNVPRTMSEWSYEEVVFVVVFFSN